MAQEKNWAGACGPICEEIIGEVWGIIAFASCFESVVEAQFPGPSFVVQGGDLPRGIAVGCKRHHCEVAAADVSWGVGVWAGVLMGWLFLFFFCAFLLSNVHRMLGTDSSTCSVSLL